MGAKALLIHPSYHGVCGRHGTEDLCVTPGELVGCLSASWQAKRPYKLYDRFKDQIRHGTRRKAPLTTQELIAQVNPVIRGWGNYYCKAHVRKLFNRLDRWIIHRLRSHRHRRWRCCGWKTLPEKRLYGEFGLVSLLHLIPSIGPHRRCAFVKA